MVLSKRSTVSAKCVLRGNYNEGARSISSDSAESLPICLTRPRNSNVETNPQVRNVDSQLKCRCRHDASDASRLESLLNLPAILHIITGPIWQDIGLGEQFTQLRLAFLIAARHRQAFHALP